MPLRPALAFLLGSLALALLLAASASAQTVRGRVVERAGGGPLAGATVSLGALPGGDVYTAATDGDGFFLLAGIAPGRYALAVTYVGYAPHRDTLALAAAAGRVLGITLRPGAETLREIVVERARPADAGATRLDPREARALPSAAPGGDLGALLSALPGVVTLDEGGGLFVRGGEAVHTLFLVDGIPMLQPLHAWGGLVALPPEAVAYLDAYPGGVPARFGGRLGAAFDVGLRSGSKRRVEASGAVGPALASVRVEAPLVPGAVSLLVAGREQLFGPFTPGAKGPGATGRTFRSADGLARVHAFLTQTASASATAFATHDDTRARDAAGRPIRVRWTNEGAGARLSYLPTAAPVLTDVRVYAARLRLRSDLPRRGARTSDVETAGGEASFRYLFGERGLHVGLFAATTRFAGTTGSAGTDGARGDFEEYVTEGGAFVDGAFVLGRLRVEPGVRVHGFPSRSRVSVEPRVRASARAGAHRLLAAAGVQAQEVAGQTLGAGAADVFVAWRTSPENAPIPRAVHAEAGWNGPLAPRVRAGLTAYARRLDGLGEAGATTGRADGIEASAEGGTGPLALRLAYGFSRVRYTPGAGEPDAGEPDAGEAGGNDTGADDVDVDARAPYAPPHERPHRAEAALRVRPRGPFRLDARFSYGAGTPYRRVRGFYERLPGPPFGEGPGVPEVVLGERARLPATARLDIAATFARRAGRFAFEAQAGVVNAFGRRSVVYLDPFTLARVDGPGVVPVLSVRVEVR